MAKQKYVYVCSECGTTSPRWYGKCPGCEGWNTFVEEAVESTGKINAPVHKSKTVPVALNLAPSYDVDRYVLGMPELDGVLGGGIVPGSSILLGGEPGIGKSTLLLQAAMLMGSQYGTVLYISGEESANQIKMRAERLGALCPQVLLLTETDMNEAINHIEECNPILIILDSIQAVYLPEMTAAPGSVSQVRQCSAKLLEYVRAKNIAVILVGHVTKEGMLAGPRVLEHMVDTVLYFEGDRHNSFRLLRAAKNRFGSTNEIGVFEMQEKGLTPFSDPSSIFLEQRPEKTSGSAVTCVMQGTRPMLLEVQALTAPTAFGNPRRLASGIDYNRLLIIIAVLERKLGLSLGNQDIYVNVAGGMRVDDTGVDLAIAAAICSSFKDRDIAAETIIMGEIGLLGEVRSISQVDRRLKEGAKFGFLNGIIPAVNSKIVSNVKPLTVKNVKDALILLGLI